MINYYILNSVINLLDNKYKRELEDYQKIYTAANYINMFDYYAAFKPFKKNYNLKEKMLSMKTKETLEFFVNNIRESKYDIDLIMLFYGYLTQQAIKEIINPYIVSLAGNKKNKQDKLLKIISNLDYDKVINKQIILNEVEEKILNLLFTEPYHFSYGLEIVQNANKNYNFFQNKKFKSIKFIYFFLLDSFSKSNIHLGICHHRKNIDYTNTLQNPWLNPYTNEYELLSFEQLVNKTIELAKKYIDYANNAIYYNNKKQLLSITIETKQIQIDKCKNPVFIPNTNFKLKHK